MPHQRALYLLAAMQVTHVVDFMLLMPLGPQLMRLFGVSPTQFSIAVSAYAFAAAISGLCVAMIADRFDRKSLLLVVYGGLALATLACAIAPTFEALVAARILAGLFGGVMSSVTYAIVGDLVPASHRGRAMGIIGVAFPVAATLGVPLSLLLAQHLGWHAPFLTLAALCAALWFGIVRFLPSVTTHLAELKPDHNPLRTLWTAITHPTHRSPLLLTALITFSSFSVIPFIAPVFTKNHILDEKWLPLAYFVGGIATLVCVPQVGKLADRFGKRVVFFWANIGAIVAVIFTTQAYPVPLPFVLAQWAFFMVMTSARWTPALALITGATKPQLRGSFLSINSSVLQLANGLGTFFSGLILVSRADGGIANFQFVGISSVAFACAAFWIVRRVQAIS